MIVLIDLSSIAYPLWHISQSEPDPNYTSAQVVAKVHRLTAGQPHAAICCDAGRSFRKDITPTYKANRPEHDASLQHQIALAVEALTRDGFPIWAVRGFEADDIIASAVTKAMETTDQDVLIVTADKDLLQLVDTRVTVKSPTTDAVLDVNGVFAKVGVYPGQIVDYLSLVGDKSDNVIGAKDIGPKTAAKLLAEYDTLLHVYQALTEHGTKFTPALATNLREFEPRRGEVEQLITLRDDAEIPFHEVLTPRVAQSTTAFLDEAQAMADERDFTETEPTPSDDDIAAAMPDAPPAPRKTVERAVVTEAKPAAPTGLSVIQPKVVDVAPQEWELQLDPRSMSDARMLAGDLYQSKMFSAYGNPQAVLSSVILGRELGLPAMSSLRSIHVIEGKHTLAAALMVALVLKSGLAEFFDPIEFDAIKAIYETKRKGARNPVRMVHTFEMARQAWPKGKLDWEKSFMASGWGRNPTDMLCARASSRLARMVYPDLMAGLYTPEEMIEVNADRREGNVAPSLEQAG